MYYILFYKTVDDYVEKRVPFREEHLKAIKEAHTKGDLLMAGALAEPADAGVFVFKGETPEIAEDFAKNDPYVLNDLITEWEVRPWNVVVGG